MAAIITLNPEGRTPQIIAIIGVGLIGSAIKQFLCEHFSVSINEIATSWAISKQPDYFKLIGQNCDHAVSHISQRLGKQVPLKILWSAGSAGFGASTQDLEPEMSSFTHALQQCEVFSKNPMIDSLSFFLLSSLGGIFEGSRLIDDATSPEPLRPYGHLKLSQEAALLSSKFIHKKRILRLTTIYGYVRSRQRRSVIGTMVYNGLAQRVTPITGRMTTLRDFIWIEDLADAIANLVVDDSNPEVHVSLMASCKPSSLMEIQKIVSETIGRPLYVSYVSEASNAVDITVRNTSNYKIVDSSSLIANVQKIYLDLLTRGSIL